MRRLGLVLALVALLAPAAANAAPHRITPAEVAAIDDPARKLTKTMEDLNSAHLSVLKGCDTVKKLPPELPRGVVAKVKASFRKIPTTIGNEEAGFAADFTKLASQAAALGDNDVAYTDSNDQLALQQGVQDMTVGLHLFSTAAKRYAAALDKAKAFDCGEFDFRWEEASKLFSDADEHYSGGHLALVALASKG